jgi:hypothetical protein
LGRRRFMTTAQSLQYHLPFGRSLIPTQSKWNHSILHCQNSISDEHKHPTKESPLTNLLEVHKYKKQSR